MKYIIKGVEPECLVEYRGMANEDWQPSYDDLGGSRKDIIKEALMVEQGYICCYCERELELKDSHIEHFIPQSHSSCDPLDYNNMLCSCMKERKKGDVLHCGAKKDNWYDEVLLVSPFDPSCEGKFVYTDDGRIKPSENGGVAAKETIEKLGLDCQKLVDERKKILEVLIAKELTNEEMHELFNQYLMREGGKFKSFWTMVDSKRVEYFG